MPSNYRTEKSCVQSKYIIDYFGTAEEVNVHDTKYVYQFERKKLFDDSVKLLIEELRLIKCLFDNENGQNKLVKYIIETGILFDNTCGYRNKKKYLFLNELNKEFTYRYSYCNNKKDNNFVIVIHDYHFSKKYKGHSNYFVDIKEVDKNTELYIDINDNFLSNYAAERAIIESRKSEKVNDTIKSLLNDYKKTEEYKEEILRTNVIINSNNDNIYKIEIEALKNYNILERKYDNEINKLKKLKEEALRKNNKKRDKDVYYYTHLNSLLNAENTYKLKDVTNKLKNKARKLVDKIIRKDIEELDRKHNDYN